MTVISEAHNANFSSRPSSTVPLTTMNDAATDVHVATSTLPPLNGVGVNGNGTANDFESNRDAQVFDRSYPSSPGCEMYVFRHSSSPSETYTSIYMRIYALATVDRTIVHMNHFHYTTVGWRVTRVWIYPYCIARICTGQVEVALKAQSQS